jgi:leucyl-tRNA synthetase
MFLGPLEQANLGTQQVFQEFGFLKNYCRLYFDEHNLIVTDEVPAKTT